MKRILILPATILIINCGGGGTSTPTALTSTSPPTPLALTLMGTLRDSQSNATLSAANVHILDGPAANRSTTTDASGNYSFTGLTPAGFNVRFSRSGYTSVDRGVNLIQDTRLDLTLAPVPPPSPPPSAGGGTPPSSWSGPLPPRTSGSHPVCQATLPNVANCVNDIVGPPQAICDDRAFSCSTGSGTCSSHGGVYCWRQ